MTLNIEKLTELRDFIAGLSPKKLKMSEWRNECNTVCCIGGWAEIQEAERRGISLSEYDESGDDIAKILGLSERQKIDLFYPPRWISHGDLFTPAQAAAAIDSLIKTGEVTWPENTP